MTVIGLSALQYVNLNSSRNLYIVGFSVFFSMVSSMYKLKHFIIMYTSPNIIRVIKSTRMRWVGYRELIGEMRNAYNILVGKPEEKRPLRRLRHRWGYNIRMDFMEIG
jgi:nucleobase transporter 1/2